MAAFEKGRAKTGGRKKGTKNRVVAEAASVVMERIGVDPLMKLLELGAEAHKEGDKALAVQCYKEIAKYTYPQLKAVDHQHSSDGAIVFEVNMIGIDPDQTDGE